MVCGKVSGNVEAIDVDLKNDPTGDLDTKLIAAIEELYPDFIHASSATIIDRLKVQLSIYELPKGLSVKSSAEKYKIAELGWDSRQSTVSPHPN